MHPPTAAAARLSRFGRRRHRTSVSPAAAEAQDLLDHDDLASLLGLLLPAQRIARASDSVACRPTIAGCGSSCTPVSSRSSRRLRPTVAAALLIRLSPTVLRLTNDREPFLDLKKTLFILPVLYISGWSSYYVVSLSLSRPPAAASSQHQPRTGLGSLGLQMTSS